MLARSINGGDWNADVAIGTGTFAALSTAKPLPPNRSAHVAVSLIHVPVSLSYCPMRFASSASVTLILTPA
jgi:hypothetical protein